MKMIARLCCCAAAFVLVSCAKPGEQPQTVSDAFARPFSLTGTLEYEENVMGVFVVHTEEKTQLTLTDGALAGCGFSCGSGPDGALHIVAFCEDVQMPFAARGGILQLFEALSPKAEELRGCSGGFESAGGIRYTLGADGMPCTIQSTELTLKIDAFEQAASAQTDAAAKETEHDGA